MGVYKSIQKGYLNMKKAHIYGAVAAAMRLAPATAQVLVKDGELPDPAAAVQEGEEAVVIDTMAAEKTAAKEGNQEKNLDPYQVSSADELDAVRYDLNAHYVQIGNIDLSGVE